MSRFFDYRQQRSKHALEAVKTIQNEEPKIVVAFAGNAKKLPMRILNAGLGHALVFITAKELSPELINVLSHWLYEAKLLPPNKNLVEYIPTQSSFWLQKATAETLNYLEWLNRHAESNRLKGSVE